jgi:hypothetical protein
MKNIHTFVSSSVSVIIFWAGQSFFTLKTILCKPFDHWCLPMKPKEAKDCSEILRVVGKDYAEASEILNASMKGVTREAQSLKKLWREKNQSRLVRLGVAIMLIPDPGFSDVVGAAVVAAGLIHNRIKNSGIYLEDVYKTYPRLLKELYSSK